MPRFGDPEPLGPDHVLSGFDCGIDSLSTWLPKHARRAAASGSARTYVVEDAEHDRVIGYHALCAASARWHEASARAAVGCHAIQSLRSCSPVSPSTESVQGRGVGRFLLRDAMARTLAAAADLGVRILLVHALRRGGADFYLHHAFEPSRTNPLNLNFSSRTSK